MFKEVICMVVFMLGICCTNIALTIVCMVTAIIMWPKTKKED